MWQVALLVTACCFSVASSQAPKPPLVLVYAKNIDAAATSVFFQSLARYAPQAHIVLFTTPDHADTARYHGVEVITEGYGMNSGDVHFCKADGTCRTVTLVAHLHRHAVVSNYLQQHMDKYSLALACDVRDVAFQMDVFATPMALDLVTNSKVLITTEDPPPGYSGANRVTVTQQEWNARWVRSCWGEEVLQQHFTNKSILNSGFLLGNPKALQMFTGDIIKTFFNACPPDVFQPGLDQGIANWLVYVGQQTTAQPYSVQVQQNGDIVFQMGMTVLQTPMHVDRFLRVLNAEGKPFPVLHQFDRIPLYMRIMQQRYPYEEQNVTGRYNGKMVLVA